MWTDTFLTEYFIKLILFDTDGKFSVESSPIVQIQNHDSSNDISNK